MPRKRDEAEFVFEASRIMAELDIVNLMIVHDVAGTRYLVARGLGFDELADVIEEIMRRQAHGQ